MYRNFNINQHYHRFIATYTGKYTHYNETIKVITTVACATIFQFLVACGYVFR